MQCGREVCLSRVRILAPACWRAAPVILCAKSRLDWSVCESLPAPMNVTTIPRTSPRMGLRVFVLMLAWVVMAGLSWADLIGVQAESHGVPPDAQWATKPDLDELRDDATTKVLTEDALPANHVLYASAISSSVPSSAQDIPLPPAICSPNSPSIDCNPSNSVLREDSSTRSSFGAGWWRFRRPRVARTWARERTGRRWV